MIKKLDSLILKAFIGPFIATFFITTFVLVLQFFWLYIDDIVGKGIDLIVIAQLISYVAANVVPLSLPLAVLLSSIMTFGNLGETFELVAIKSAGIPLLRFMRPMMVFSLCICGVAFAFNNNIIPVAKLKMNRLKYDIINKKPAFNLREGSFYTMIPNYAIKVGKKEKDDSTLTNVVIYEKVFGLRDNIIVANKGIMRVSADKRFLEFSLRDGWRYQERGNRMTTNTEYIRLGFKEFTKVFDLSTLAMNNTADSLFKDNYEMLSERQLTHSIDSLHAVTTGFGKKIYAQLSASIPMINVIDTMARAPNGNVIPKMHGKSLAELVPDSQQANLMDRAYNLLTSTKGSVDIVQAEYETRRKELRMYEIAWHEKITLSIACLVLFLIGAPLGSIIRKGGIGTPLVFAVIFFVIFFLLNNFGKKFAKQEVMTPGWGMWLGTLILFPIGFFLTYKAMRDSQLFNQEFYYRTFRKLQPYLKRFFKKKALTQT